MADYAPGHIIIKTTLDTSGAVKQGENLGKELEKAIEKGSSLKIPSGIKEIEKEANKAEKSVDKVEKELEQIETQSEKTGRAGKKAGADMGQSFDKASGQAKALMTAIKGVILGYTGKKLTDFFIGSNADMEQYLASFDTMLGSTEKAETLMSNLQNMANKTPFDTEHLTSASQTLLAYGESVENLQDDLAMLGDISQGNAEKLSSLALAFGQIQSTGRLTGQDLLQLINVGFNPLQIISEQTSKSMADLKKEMEEGKISFEMVRSAMQSATSQGGIFFEAMEKQSQTLKGMLSTLGDEFAQFGRDAGSEAFAELKDGFEELLAQLEQAKADGTLAEIAEDVGSAIAGTVKIIVTTTRFLIEHRDIIIALGSAYAGWKTAMIMGNTISSVVRGIKSIIDMVKALNLTRKINLGVLSATEIAEKSATISSTAAAAQKRVLAVATDKATGSQIAYNVALSANPIILVLSALVALTAGLVAFSAATKKGDESAKELNNSFKEMEQNTQLQIAKSESELKVLAGKIAKYDELRNKLNLTSAESSQLQSLAESLQSTFGNEVKVVDELTGKYNDLNSAYTNYADNIKKQAKEIEFQNKLDWYDEQINKLESDINALEPSAGWTNFGKGVDWVVPEYLTGGFRLGDYFSDKADKKLLEKIWKIRDAIDELEKEKDGFIESWAKGTKSATDSTNAFAEQEKQRVAEISEAYQSAKESLRDFLAYKGDTKVVGDIYDTVREKVTELGGDINTLIPITTQMANTLQDAGAGAAVSFDKATGAASVSLSALQDHLEAVREQVKKTFLEAAKLELDAKYQAVSRYGNQMSMSGGRASETEKALYEKANQEYENQLKHYKELESLIKSMDADYAKIYAGQSTFAGNSTSSNATTKGKTAAQIAAENYKTALAYQKDLQRLGIISEEDYLKQISALRKKYSNMDKATFHQSQIEEKELKEKLAKQALQAKVESYNDEIANQKWRLEIGIISEKEYYKKLAEARKKYLKQGTDEWKSSYKESFAYIKSTADEQTQAILESMNKVVSARDGAMQKMVDNAKIYTKEAVTIPESTAEKGLWKITTHEHTKDGMNTDNSRLREALAENALYEALRKQLIEKKANAYILETFDSLSVEDAILYAQSVLSKSSADWKEYNQLAGQVQSSSKARATRMYQSDVDDIKQGFVDKVNATFKGLTGDMALHGQSLVKSLVDGWNEEFKKSGFNSNITLSSAIKGGTLSSSPASAQLAAQQAQIAPEITISAAPVKIENKTVIELTAYGKVLAQLTLEELQNLSKETGIQFLLNN